MKRLKKKHVVRWITRKVVFPLVYHINAIRPIQKDKVLFMEGRFSEVTDNFTEIIRVLEQDYNLDIHYHFLLQGFVSNKETIRRQIAFVKDAATAAFLIYNDASDTQGAFKVRKGTRVLNTWHGAGAFKKFGLSTADKIFGGSRKEQLRYNAHPHYDLFTVSSPEVEWAYVEALGKEKDSESIKGVGLSRTDVFYRKEYIDSAKDKLISEFPEAAGKKVILYAPTFRGRMKRAETPDELDLELFYKELSDEYVVLIKHHPLVKKAKRPVVDDRFKAFARDVTDTMAISDLLCVSDICITDYSSLIYEYSIFERPMVFFAYDLENYCDWRGFYYNYDEMTPGPVCRTNEEMIDYIKNVEDRFDKKAVHDFREKFMSGCDGHATERIIDMFFGDRIEAYRK
ncbi:CDP-glycerol glycerophosphotransferase family protein [Butyrivibrio sp. AD3002]|uniref:CDP-glycerol glycerophosphotransferase family protein n=1 Tax=Butyrivibrio sp. AD3002 TaxID=1280670 RepID=UPI0003B35802|nr:CDP-glycerol glycerophosphotransferase family protein [Butyrivibrio sp. AD3002]